MNPEDNNITCLETGEDEGNMQKNIVNKGLVAGIILLLIGMSIPSTSASSNEDISINISAGMLRKEWGRFGLGYCIVVANHGDEKITGISYVNYSMLSGQHLGSDMVIFTVNPLCEHVIQTCSSGMLPVKRMFVTVIVEDVVATKSGYEVGPFVFLLKS